MNLEVYVENIHRIPAFAFMFFYISKDDKKKIKKNSKRITC